MKVSNAIKKLSNYGEVQELWDGQIYQVQRGDRIVEFTRNGRSDEIATVRLRRSHDLDDSQSDYSAGVFCDNLSQAIKVAGW